ncbi:MAG: type 4a pilus biogenesis protein PilO [Planctomycetota bacterium]
MKKQDGFTLTWWHVDLAGVALCVVLTFVGYGIILQPIADERDRLTAKRNELQQIQQQAHLAETSRTSLEEELKDVRQRIEDSAVHLESAAHLNGRLARLLALATDSGMQVDETSSGDTEDGQWHRTVPVRVSGRGSYTSCARFLHGLQAKLPDVEVLAFNLVGTPAQRSQGATFRFELAWYAAAAASDEEVSP